MRIFKARFRRLLAALQEERSPLQIQGIIQTNLHYVYGELDTLVERGFVERIEGALVTYKLTASGKEFASSY